MYEAGALALVNSNGQNLMLGKCNLGNNVAGETTAAVLLLGYKLLLKDAT